MAGAGGWIQGSLIVVAHVDMPKIWSQRPCMALEDALSSMECTRIMDSFIYSAKSLARTMHSVPGTEETACMRQIRAVFLGFTVLRGETNNEYIWR